MPVLTSTLGHPTLSEMIGRFGNVPVRRIRVDRYPATEDDVADLKTTEKRLYELVDGVLLEKYMGLPESASLPKSTIGSSTSSTAKASVL